MSGSNLIIHKQNSNRDYYEYMDSCDTSQMSPLDLERLQIKRIKKAALRANLGTQIHTIENQITDLETKLTRLPYSRTWSMNPPHTIETDLVMATANLKRQLNHLRQLRDDLRQTYETVL